MSSAVWRDSSRLCILREKRTRLIMREGRPFSHGLINKTGQSLFSGFIGTFSLRGVVKEHPPPPPVTAREDSVRIVFGQVRDQGKRRAGRPSEALDLVLHPVSPSSGGSFGVATPSLQRDATSGDAPKLETNWRLTGRGTAA